jgi:hypothetical protein
MDILFEVFRAYPIRSEEGLGQPLRAGTSRSAPRERPAGVLGPAASRLLRVRPSRAPLGRHRPLDGASRHAR